MRVDGLGRSVLVGVMSSHMNRTDRPERGTTVWHPCHSILLSSNQIYFLLNIAREVRQDTGTVRSQRSVRKTMEGELLSPGFSVSVDLSGYNKRVKI